MQFHINTIGFAKVTIFVFSICLFYLIWNAGKEFHDIKVNMSDLASYAILAVQMGGHAVVQVYQENNMNIAEKSKTDEGKAELLTNADTLSNFMMINLLQRFPGLKIRSEEKIEKLNLDYFEKYQANRIELYKGIQRIIDKLPVREYSVSDIDVWLDPLDATQEYTEGLIEYVTVMICVVLKDQPIFGVIHRPFFNQTVIGLVDYGILNEKGEKMEINVMEPSNKIIISRSHSGDVKKLATESFGKNFIIETAGGSGYKVLRLLNSTADVYLHSTSIKKWDICAGDALLKSAGGNLINLNGEQITYNGKADPVNKHGILAALKHPFTFYNIFKQGNP